jgi:hypothetical protein
MSPAIEAKNRVKENYPSKDLEFSVSGSECVSADTKAVSRGATLNMFCRK